MHLHLLLYTLSSRVHYMLLLITIVQLFTSTHPLVLMNNIVKSLLDLCLFHQIRMTRILSLEYLLRPTTMHRGDVVLFICYFITGLLDSAVFLSWGIWVAMQTGPYFFIGDSDTPSLHISLMLTCGRESRSSRPFYSLTSSAGAFDVGVGACMRGMLYLRFHQRWVYET